MRRLWPKSLFGQLLVGTVVCQALLLVLFVTYIVISQRRVAEARTRVRIEQQLNRLAAACSREMRSGNPQTLHDVLELARITPTIDAARVTDLGGATLALAANTHRGELSPEERRLLAGPLRQQIVSLRNGQLEAVTPVLQAGQPVALLWLEPTQTPPTNVNLIRRICLTYGLFALLTNIIPLFLIVRTVTRPLRRLRGATQRVAHHQDLGREFPMPVIRGNEAGDLTESFNTMVEELSKQRAGLLETVALLDSMLENAPTGFAFFDRDLRYVKLNTCLAQMLDSSVEQELGHSVTETQPRPMAASLQAHLQRVFETGESVRNVELTAPVSGSAASQRSWLLHFYPVLLADRSVKWAGVIIADITERLKAEEALRRTEKLAAAGRLAASIAHEINNPLESVTNLLYLLATHDDLDPTAREFVTAAQSELARVSEITQQTLRFYRQSTSPARVEVAEILNSVLALYQPRLASAHVQVIRKLQPGTEIFALSGELRQVFANLVGNAVDAMPEGGCLHVRVRRGWGRDAEGVWRRGVRACLADNGTGMSPETQHRLFEAFFTTKQTTGTGLGLWISHEIVQKHAGAVRVRSRQGERSGTLFAVFLPEGGLEQRTPGKSSALGGPERREGTTELYRATQHLPLV